MLFVHEKSMTRSKVNTELLMEDHKKQLEMSLANSEQAQQDVKVVALASQHELEEKLLLMTEAAEELRLLNEKKLNDIRESVRKEKEAKDLLCRENIQLKERISHVTSDSKLAKDDHRATFSTIKKRLDSLQSDHIKLQAERDHAVKEAENIKLQEAENIQLLEAETLKINRKLEKKFDLMNKQEEELRLTIENCKQSISDFKTEKLELESTNANQDEKHKKNMEEFHKREKEEKDVLLSEIEKLNRRNSDLIMEKEQKIKELQEEIEQKLELESTKANEICHLRNEMELLSKNNLEKIELLDAETMRGTEKKLLLMNEQAEELRLENEKYKQRISALITEKEDHIKKLHEENQKKLELESTKTTEMRLQRKEIELLNMQIEWLSRKQEDNVSKLHEANEQKQNLELAEVKAVSLLMKEIELLKSKHEQEQQKLFGDSERARMEHQVTLSTIKDRVVTLESDCSTLKDERDNAIKEAAKLQKLRECILCRSNTALSSDFTLQELEQATQNFSDLLKIGEGGFGCVYKGSFRGTTVAIKKLNSQSMQGLPEFQREVDILTRVRHPNLVNLIGACSEASALVYEFLPNGSLEAHLTHENSAPPLNWQVRTRIISEICLALIFLHSNKPHLVVHGDLKPDNILLDANFVSKLSDFGISRIIKQSDTTTTLSYRTLHPAGTPGYVDPEFAVSGEQTAKSDVYAFGIIILRLVTGKFPLRIAMRVTEAMQNNGFHTMIDASAGNWPFDQAKKLAEVGLKCAEMSRSNRPNLVNEVWPILKLLMDSCLVSTPSTSSESTLNENQIPSQFICPIFQDIMKDPHIAADGFTYEAEAIRSWLKGATKTSPMTNLPLDHYDLIPNFTLRSAIQEWLLYHPQQ